MKIKLTTSIIFSAMKNMFIIIAGLLLLASTSADSNARSAGEGIPADQSITVVCSPDLTGLATQWAAEYASLNPEMEIKVMESEAGLTADAISSGAFLGLVTDKYLKAGYSNDLLKMTLGRDVVIPVMNANNPFREEIYARGITAELLATLGETPRVLTWGTFLGDEKSSPISVYIAREGFTVSGVQDFLGKELVPGKGIVVTDANALLEAIEKDPYAIGFCRVTDIIDLSSHSFKEGLVPLPIDRNTNGQLDYFENIYASPDAFTRGIWVGKYPKELITGIYSVSSASQGQPQEKAFLKWILTAGQKQLGVYGFSELASGEIRSGMDKLTEESIIIEASGNNYAGFKVIIMILVVSIVAGIIIEAIILYNRGRKAVSAKESPQLSGSFSEESVNLPKGLYYDKTHTWAFMQSDGRVKIGLDDFLPRVTGHLTSIKMKEAGERIKKGEVVLTLIQKGKQLDIKSPVSGIILEQNKRLHSNAAAVNFSPYSDGWVYMVEPTNWLREIQLLLLADKFRSWLHGEFTRLKDFLTLIQNNPESRYAPVVYQDGGELKESVLMDLGPEVWEDFQSHYIETTT